MIGPWFLCGTVFVCSFLIAATTWYSGFFLLSIVTRFACDIGHDLDLGFIWGHHHLHLVCLVSLVGMNDQSTSWLQLATPCWRDPTRSKQLSTVAILRFQFGLYHVVAPLSFLRSITLHIPLNKAANQNAGKPYSTEPSHWSLQFKYHAHMVENSYATLSRGITVKYLTRYLYFLGIHTHQKI